MNFNFPYKERCGISHLLSNGSRDSIQVIEVMCTYDPEERSVLCDNLLFYSMYKIDEVYSCSFSILLHTGYITKKSCEKLKAFIDNQGFNGEKLI